MRVPTKLVSICIRALTQSMDTDVMKKIACDLVPGYNIHQRTGYPASMPVPNKEAAKQIVTDMVKVNLFHDFVAHLIAVDENGIMGKRFSLPYMRQIIKGTLDLGLVWDRENRTFIEDQRVRKTRNWSTLRLGKEYLIAFLRADITGNSGLVRRYPREIIQKTYNDLRDIFTHSVEKRNGRVWDWEGDGGTAAFVFGNQNQHASLSGIEILHELYLYNKLTCPLDIPLTVRLSAHSGPFEYFDDEEKLKTSETIKRLIHIEQALTPPGTFTISQVIRDMLDGIVSNEFSLVQNGSQVKYFNYSFKQECL